MTKKELSRTLAELQELTAQEKELREKIEQHHNALKAHLMVLGVEKLTHDGWRIAWTTFEASRLDVKKFAAELPEIAAQYTRKTSGKRFTVQNNG